ncbi:MAG: AAA family ATPase [Ilumatobacteraceae bacterium]
MATPTATQWDVATGECACTKRTHLPKFVAVTGGPGAGKTAVLEIARRSLCSHVIVLPESAGIVFGGGFPRGSSAVARHASQRTIYHVQIELQRLVLEEQQVAIALCDRGTVDSLAYWSGESDGLWRDVNSDLQTEIARYAAVIHLRTPSAVEGYNQSNPLRTESVNEALRLDGLIERAWATHPNRHIVTSASDFVSKTAIALDLIRAELPECCRTH